MAKASRVHYSGTAPFVDDVQVNRVQALGSSSRLTTEDMKELGSLNIVEIVDDVPQVDVSVDQNENGTNDLIALLANKGYGCQVIAVPEGNQLGSNKVKVKSGSYLVGEHRVYLEGTELTIDGPGEQVVYLVNEVAGNKVEVGSTAPNGSIEIARISGGAVDAGVITQADITDARPKSMTQVTGLDYELSNVDLSVPVKQSGGGDEISRTMYMEKAYLNNFDMSFQVNGVATNAFKLETDNKRWFLNTSAHVVVDEYKATEGQTDFPLTQDPSPLNNGNKLLCLYKNGKKLAEGTDFSVSSQTVTITDAAVAGDLFKARYTAAEGGQLFTSNNPDQDPSVDLAGGVKEGQVEIYLSDDQNNRVTRVQSARISLPLNREQLDELGTMYPYDRPLQLPISINVSLELKDSDLELMARFAGKNVETATEIALEDLVKNMGVVVKIYRETDVKRDKLPAGHPDKLAIKTISVDNLIPQSENWDVRVDSDASQSYEFMAHNILVEDKLV
ncbi:hypothetical protein [Chengkuizengella axinellae]|uniref:Baseplate protein J-like domain-containing protein n=1 Tax=Chengkuizengella axinellae TaxID=3064388 RepID=A0ABT9IWG1_9BACL|nr:hypothetical protein [Chengkuizengella sp. 2205SS18-9]MDP5273657.1 hypothetical protein [Chengkuizengella sp. 2205SS18-9]